MTCTFNFDHGLEVGLFSYLLGRVVTGWWRRLVGVLWVVGWLGDVVGSRTEGPAWGPLVPGVTLSHSSGQTRSPRRLSTMIAVCGGRGPDSGPVAPQSAIMQRRQGPQSWIRSCRCAAP